MCIELRQLQFQTIEEAIADILALAADAVTTACADTVGNPVVNTLPVFDAQVSNQFKVRAAKCMVLCGRFIAIGQAVFVELQAGRTRSREVTFAALTREHVRVWYRNGSRWTKRPLHSGSVIGR